MEERKNMIIPWQISTPGMVLGFFFGIAPLLISIVGNYQYKQGKEIKELIKAYNIIFIIYAVLLGIIILWFIFIMLITFIAVMAN